MRFLVLRLQAPLMAFGDVAVDELRPTRELPTASQLTGLIANALGLRFPEGARLQRLQERLIYGSRLDRSGSLLRDFQTAALGKDDKLWRTGPHGPAERAGGAASFSGPTLRERFYRADARVTVALTLHPESEAPTLDELAWALRRPFRPLFLGRVSCPPAAPLYHGEEVHAADVRQALELVAAQDCADAGELPAEWPADGPGGSLPETRVPGDLRTARDLRDWANDIHAGSRRVVRGMVAPPRSATGEVLP